MGLESSVGLIVATLDLELVRLLRAAMQPGGGASVGPARLIQPGPTIAPRRRAGAEPVIEPRPHVRPEPVFEPRMKLRGGVSSAAEDGRCAQVTPAEATETSRPSSSPVEPPWKVRPWEQTPLTPPPRPVRKIKVLMTRPDSYCKGAVIDLFI